MLSSKSRRNQRYRDEIKLWFIEYRATLSCKICGEDHPATLSFHHTDPATKKYNVADMPNRGCSKKLILSEIDKCQVLCHNCHAKVHWNEQERPCVTRSVLSS